MKAVLRASPQFTMPHATAHINTIISTWLAWDDGPFRIGPGFTVQPDRSTRKTIMELQWND